MLKQNQAKIFSIKHEGMQLELNYELSINIQQKVLEF
jgi:hypothetical protein